MTHIGTTRDNFEGKKVVRLEYEAYESQALAEMKKICTLIREKWSVYGIALLHRIGLVYIEDHWPRGPTQTILMYFIIYFGNLKQQFTIFKICVGGIKKRFEIVLDPLLLAVHQNFIHKYVVFNIYIICRDINHNK